MKRLENIILDRIDDESLYQLHLIYPSLQIDKEWKRRLVSCDPELYLPVLDLFQVKNIPKTLYIRQGLYELRNCFPFRIAVIYDYRTGQVKSLEIRLGYNRTRYTYEGNPILFSWLDANESKKLLREVISSNAGPSMFSVGLDNEKSKGVRDILLDNKTVNLDVLKIAATNVPFLSFPMSGPLTGGEDFVIYPHKISIPDKSVILFPSNFENSSMIFYSNISVKYSPDVMRYLSVISQN